MNVIIKDDERRERHEQILRDFGHDPQTANREAREQAEIIAETLAAERAGAEVSRPAGRAEPQAGACRPARGSGKPRQAGVLVQHEPRHPHPDERHYRLYLAGGDPY